MRNLRGGGSMRQRRPGVWEVRVAVGRDPVSGRSRYRSLTVHGDREAAQTARERWAAKAELVRSAGRARPGITIAVLLREWLGTDHGWRPSTIAGYRSVVGFLDHDPVATRRVVDLTPAVLAAACTAWRSQGWPDPTVSSRIRVLRSAVGWAYAERILDLHPLDGMRGPPQADVRMHAPVDHVRAILRHARQNAIDAATGSGDDRSGASGLAPGRADAAAHPIGRRLRCAAGRTRRPAVRGSRRRRADDRAGHLERSGRTDQDRPDPPAHPGTDHNEAVAGHRLDSGGTAARRPPVRAVAVLRRTDHTTRLTTSCLGHWFAELSTRPATPR